MKGSGLTKGGVEFLGRVIARPEGDGGDEGANGRRVLQTQAQRLQNTGACLQRHSPDRRTLVPGETP